MLEITVRSWYGRLALGGVSSKWGPSLGEFAPIRRAISLIAASISAFVSAGCSETSLSSMLANPMTSVKTVAAVQERVPTEPAFVVSVAPIHGPPSAFVDALVVELNTSALERNIALLVDKDAKGDYLLRGNFVASRSNATVSLAYNWDILDRNGVRVTRVTNEETQNSPASTASPWADLSQATIKATAGKVMASLAGLGKPAK
jgi:hypothetical protein